MAKISVPVPTGRRALALACAPCALGAALLTAAPASAQVGGGLGDDFGRDRNVSVRERPRPAYDALGMRAGAFLLYPKVTLGATYDDNIYANDNNKVSDSVLTAEGQLNLISDWTRHRLTGFLRGAHSEYLDQDSESNSTYGIGTSGRLDVKRDFNLTGAAQFNHEIESRTASGTPQSSRKPVSYDATGLDAGFNKVFNRVRAKGAFSYRGFDFNDYTTNSGTFVSQDYRDENNYTGTLQVDYALSPDTAIYVQGVRDWRTFRTRSPVSPIDRDSDGYQVNVGADFDLTALARGHIQAGYLKHNFDDPTINGISSVAADASVEYFPTQLLTLTFLASRKVNDTGLFNTSGYLSTDGSVQADYELLRNLILTGRLGYGHDNYRGIDRTDKRFYGNIGAIYLINRTMGVNLSYYRYDQSSHGAQIGPEYGINRVSLSLTLQR